MASNFSTIVAWNDAYALGVPEVDAQHQALFGMINEVWQAIVTPKAGANVTGILLRLEHYTLMHFNTEEALMRAINYPRFDEHRNAHQAFIRQVAGERHRQATGQPLGLDMLHFLNNWLIDHVMEADRAYLAHYHALNRPRGWLSRFFKPSPNRSPRSG